MIIIQGHAGKHVDWNNAEDVARGWGFTQTAKSGNVVVRWERVNKYLDEFGFIPTSGDGVGANDFIPENMVYRLGFKASNETAQAFQALLADEVLPAIRKTGSYSSKPMTQLEIIAANAAALVEHERALRAIETRQDQQAEQMQAICDTVIVRPDQKRQWINGLFQAYQCAQ